MTQKLLSLALLVSLALAGLALSTPTTYAQDEAEPGTILEVLQADGRFKSFVALIEAGALADNLDLGGPYTVLAPTDAAFEAFDASSAPANLTEILLYHVINGTYPAQNVVNHDSFTTLVGEHVTVNTAGDTVTLDGRATITGTDLQASNGVIHVVDAVLVPGLATTPAVTADTDTADTTEPTTTSGTPAAAATADLGAALEADGRFTTLLSLLRDTGLLATLEGRNDFTLFAPTDAAFAEVPDKRMDELTADLQGEIRTILLHHVVGDSLTINQIATDNLIPALDGRPLFVSRDDGQVLINGSQFRSSGQSLANGTVYVIDEVLVP